MARKSRVVALGAAVGIGIAIMTRWREQVFGLLRRGRTQAAEPPVASSSWESEPAEEEQPTEESAQPEAP
jgi:hypothetical protein